MTDDRLDDRADDRLDDRPDEEFDRWRAWRVRGRRLLDRWFVVAVAALVVVAGAGLALAYEPHVQPETEAVEQPVEVWSEEASMSHQAEVQQPNEVFDLGSNLTNRSSYYQTIAPELDGTYEYVYYADDGDLSVDVEAYLEHRSVDGEEVLWQRTEPLASERYDDLEPGESATVTFRINASEIEAQVERIHEDLGTSIGTTESAVVVETTVSGEIEGEQTTTEHQQRLDVDPGGDVYHVESSPPMQETYQTTLTEEVERTYGPLRSYGPFGLVALALAGIAVLWRERSRGSIAPTDEELLALDRYQTRREFDDWISRGRIPETRLDGEPIVVSSLADLVDVAIDSDRRVIEDPARDVFAVVDGDNVYTFSWADDQLGDEWPRDGDSVADPDEETDGDERSQKAVDLSLDDGRGTDVVEQVGGTDGAGPASGREGGETDDPEP